jgi:hypothetical protein
MIVVGPDCSARNASLGARSRALVRAGLAALASVSGMAMMPALGCGGSSPKPAAPPPATFLPVTFTKGDTYFTWNGRQQPIALRNITGSDETTLSTLLDDAMRAGTRLVRIHVTHGHGVGITSAGAIDETWAAVWDRVLDRARVDGISVMPVFGVWADWNNGVPNLGFQNWNNNPLNSALGGPAHSPGELVQTGTETQSRWVAWMRALVDRWQSRDNIAAWEIFSELDIMTGTSEAAGASFAAIAAAAIHAGDPVQRPVLASLSALTDWPTLSGGDAVDILEVHPYDADLDLRVISSVANLRARYGKPVLLAESGLDASAPDTNPITASAGAPVGVAHAIWAAIVSRSMGMRALWWEDGYAIYYPSLGLPFVESYKDAERAAVSFVDKMPPSFAHFEPLIAVASPGIAGAAIGDGTAVVGWVRDAACRAPAFGCTSTVSAQQMTLTVPGATGTWNADFFATSGGTDVSSSARIEARNGTLSVALPDFTGDVAFRVMPPGGG